MAKRTVWRVWQEEEFEIPLQDPRLSDQELSRLLPETSPGAIATVRAFIHSYHEGRNTSGLSKLMTRRLAQGS